MSSFKDLLEKFHQEPPADPGTGNEDSHQVESEKDYPGADPGFVDEAAPVSQGVRDNLLKGPVLVVMDSGIHIPLGIPEKLHEDLKKLFTFSNPAYFKAVNHTLTPPDKWIYAYYETDGFMVVPRGAIRKTIHLFQKHKMLIRVEDRTISQKLSQDMDASVLFPDLAAGAFSDLFEKRNAIFEGQGGVGVKVQDSISAVCRIIAHRCEKTLVVVKRIFQLHSWKTTLMRELNLSDQDIGLVGDTFDQIDRDIVIAIDRSLYRHVKDITEQFGFLIIDRCEAANPKIFFQIVWKMKAKYLLGISFFKREDGLDRFMRVFLGERISIAPIWPDNFRHEKKNIRLMQCPGVWLGDLVEYNEIVDAIIQNENRNAQIVSDILAESSDRHLRVMVVSVRIEHLNIIADMLSDNYKTSEIIYGKTGDKAVGKKIAAFNENKIQVLLTTNKTISGIEVDPVDAVFSITPFKHRDSAAAMIRSIKDNGALYDYVDDNLFCNKSFEKRKEFFLKMGVK